MIPHTIQRSQILNAIGLIKRGEIAVPSQRRSKKYDLLFDGKRYPPKYTVSVAYKNLNPAKKELHGFSGGAETNNFLASRDFLVVDKKTGKRIGIMPVDEDEESTFPEGKLCLHNHSHQIRR